jgi:hypothetical protein
MEQTELADDLCCRTNVKAIKTKSPSLKTWKIKTVNILGFTLKEQLLAYVLWLRASLWMRFKPSTSTQTYIFLLYNFLAHKSHGKRLNNKKLCAVCPSPNIICVTNARRLRWARYMARMGESRGTYRVVVGKAERSRSLGRPRRRWEHNIKRQLRQLRWGYGLDRSGTGQEQVADSCECGNETSDSIKCGEFLECFRSCKFLRKDSAPWS